MKINCNSPNLVPVGQELDAILPASCWGFEGRERVSSGDLLDPYCSHCSSDVHSLAQQRCWGTAICRKQFCPGQSTTVEASRRGQLCRFYTQRVFLKPNSEPVDASSYSGSFDHHRTCICIRPFDLDTSAAQESTHQKSSASSMGPAELQKTPFRGPQIPSRMPVRWLYQCHRIISEFWWICTSVIHGAPSASSFQTELKQ